MQEGEQVLYEFKPVTIQKMKDGKVIQIQSDYGSTTCSEGLTVVPNTIENVCISEQFEIVYRDLLDNCRNFWKGDIYRWLEARWLEIVRGEQSPVVIWLDVKNFVRALKSEYGRTINGCKLHLS